MLRAEAEYGPYWQGVDTICTVVVLATPPPIMGDSFSRNGSRSGLTFRLTLSIPLSKPTPAFPNSRKREKPHEKALQKSRHDQKRVP
jgi:hypothetical protein